MSRTTTEADLQAQIDELRAELRSLRDEPGRPFESSRRHLLKNLGVAAAGAVAGTMAAGAPVGAATGDEVILGEENAADATTILRGPGPTAVMQLLEEGSPIPASHAVLQAMANGNFLWGLAGLVREARASSPDDLPYGVVGYVKPGLPGVGIGGYGTYGGVFNGSRASVVLTCWSTRDDTAPHVRGELHQGLDDLWACVEAGLPGTWRKVAGPTTAGQLHLTPPTRIYDSRAGQVPLDVTKGKLANGAERVVDAKSGGAVPASENGGTPTAALVNLTITDTTSTGGYLALFENGTAWPGNSTINWDAVGRAVANTTVVPLDDQGRLKVRASPGGGTDFVIDVLGYWL